jgi:hypothetical protein
MVGEVDQQHRMARRDAVELLAIGAAPLEQVRLVEADEDDPLALRRRLGDPRDDREHVAQGPARRAADLRKRCVGGGEAQVVMGVDEPRIDDRPAPVVLVGVGRGGPHRVERSYRRDPPAGEPTAGATGAASSMVCTRRCENQPVEVAQRRAANEALHTEKRSNARLRWRAPPSPLILPPLEPSTSSR